MTSRAQIYRQNTPKPDVTFDDLQKATTYDPFKVDPRFLRNNNLPVDPQIEEKKQKEYLIELERWSELE